ncbi:response regulator transcription factor [Sandarakinorhabdus limnophila]|jgi:two-component system OmpR family response regulator|uniref:response regulator transcription factor n=1 Tax=Sandarakinorhabdus limnophila TaxID=210512 RepID=UPI0026E94FF9|nr:response regulator transcription factor [Sandarakinorhabdus limnophila]
MSNILCVEDDATMADHIAQGLREAGYHVDIAGAGTLGLELAMAGHYAAIVLDRMLPELDGLTVLSRLREAGNRTPVVVLSALASLDERVKGLRAGSDDYLSKPFELPELLARLEAVQRRALPSGEITRLVEGELELDLLARRVTWTGKRIDLQPREFRLLEYLVRHRGQVVTRSMLLEGVWDYHFDPGTNVIDVHVSRLRKKLDEGGAGNIVQTVRGTGYRVGGETVTA